MIQGQIFINSSDGWCNLSVEVKERTTIANVHYVIAEFGALSRFWDLAHLEKSSEYELTDAGSAKLFRVLIAVDRLHKLRGCLEQWLLDQKDFQLNLTDRADQLVQIALGSHPGFVTSQSRPVCQFSYQSSRFDTKTRFIVDQSCISQFLSGLQGLLTGVVS